MSVVQPVHPSIPPARTRGAEPPHGGGDERPSVVIIGGGFAGAAAAIRLLDAATEPLLVRIVEPRGDLGRGIAFSTPEPSHVMNGPAKLFSLYPERPESFVQFLARYTRDWGGPASATPDLANAFVPRAIYGEYVGGELTRAAEQAGPGVSFDHVQSEAVDLWREGRRFVIRLGDGRVLNATHAVLAIGSQVAAFGPAAELAGRYVPDPWKVGAFDHTPREGTALLIGSGLTMVDALLSLEKQGFQGNYVAVSRHGLLVHPRREPPPLRDFFAERGVPATALGLLRAVRAEIARAGKTRVDWQSVLPVIRPYVALLWKRADPVEKRRFLRHLRPFWEVALHRAPPGSTMLLERGRAEGWFTHRAARVEALRETGSGRIAATVRPRGREHAETIEADIVVNCTGLQPDWTRQHDRPLVQNLLRRGLVRPGPFSFGVEADGQATPIGRDGTPVSGLSVIGPALRGVRWESQTIVELVAQAASLADAVGANLQRLQHAQAA